MANPVLGKSLWLVLSRSGFCSTDRLHGNGPIRVFLFWSKAGKFNICNQDSEKKVWKLSFFTLKLPAEAKKIEIFPKFKDGWRRRTFVQATGSAFYYQEGVPYNKLLTNRACSGRTGEYWPSVVFVRPLLRSVRTVTTSGQYSPVRPSRSVSKRLIFSTQKEVWHRKPMKTKTEYRLPWKTANRIENNKNKR